MSNPKKPRTADVCRDLALPVLEELGLELWDIRFEKEGSGWYLRYFIDKPQGVNIQDCVDFSRIIDKLLDEADPIGQSYTLEVSSPGVERRLTREEHFARYVGHRIHIRLIRPREGARDLYGELLARTAEGVTLLADGGGELTVPGADIASVKLYVEL